MRWVEFRESGSEDVLIERNDVPLCPPFFNIRICSEGSLQQTFWLTFWVTFDWRRTVYWNYHSKNENIYREVSNTKGIKYDELLYQTLKKKRDFWFHINSAVLSSDSRSSKLLTFPQAHSMLISPKVLSNRETVGQYLPLVRNLIDNNRNKIDLMSGPTMAQEMQQQLLSKVDPKSQQ